MSNVNHQWFYMNKTILSEDQEGPITEKQFAELIKKGTIKPNTKVFSATRTKNRWLFAKQLPAFEKLNTVRLHEKEVAAAGIKEERQNLKAEKTKRKAEAQRQKIALNKERDRASQLSLGGSGAVSEETVRPTACDKNSGIGIKSGRENCWYCGIENSLEIMQCYACQMLP
jgi:hypothetical protein